MKTIILGHRYELENLEHPENTQTIQFIQKELVGDKLVTVLDGTTNDEVLKVLIERMNALQAKMACRENAIALTHLETALLWLEKRKADRTSRNVLGTPKP